MPDTLPDSGDAAKLRISAHFLQTAAPPPRGTTALPDGMAALPHGKALLPPGKVPTRRRQGSFAGLDDCWTARQRSRAGLDDCLCVRQGFFAGRHKERHGLFLPILGLFGGLLGA